MLGVTNDFSRVYWKRIVLMDYGDRGVDNDTRGSIIFLWQLDIFYVTLSINNGSTISGGKSWKAAFVFETGIFLCKPSESAALYRKEWIIIFSWTKSTADFAKLMI